MLRFLFSLTCAVLSGAALALLANVVLQSLLSEPSYYPKPVVVTSEARWGGEQPAAPVPSNPPAEPTESTRVRAPDKFTVAAARPATAPTPAPARDAAEAPTQLAPMAAQATLPSNIATPPGDSAPDASNPPQISTAAQAAVPASPIVDAASGTPASGTSSQPSLGTATLSPPSEVQAQAAVVQPSTEISARQQQAIASAQDNLVTTKPAQTGIAAHVSIHYRLGSTKARADAELLAQSLTSAGFDAPQMLTTGHAVQASVVRYFFRQDAGVANVATQELQNRGGTWRAEDCTVYRHKPSAGSIEVWPADVQ